MTKMGMLRSGIADPPPPNPFDLPLSKYRETRLKSTKDLLSQHNATKTKPVDYKSNKQHDESLYTTTTHHVSPVKRHVENPESPQKFRASFIETPGKDESEDEGEFDQDRYNVFH